jgi:hypothetical protein
MLEVAVGGVMLSLLLLVFEFLGIKVDGRMLLFFTIFVGFSGEVLRHIWKVFDSYTVLGFVFNGTFQLVVMILFGITLPQGVIIIAFFIIILLIRFLILIEWKRGSR